MDSKTMKAQQKAIMKLYRLLHAATGLDGYALVEFFAWVRAQRERHDALGALACAFVRKAEAHDMVAFVEQIDWKAARTVLQQASREYRESRT